MSNSPRPPALAPESRGEAAPPDPIIITVRMGAQLRVLEIPGRHFDAPLRSPLGKLLTVGYFHGMTVTLPEPTP